MDQESQDSPELQAQNSLGQEAKDSKKCKPREGDPRFLAFWKTTMVVITGTAKPSDASIARITAVTPDALQPVHFETATKGDSSPKAVMSGEGSLAETNVFAWPSATPTGGENLNGIEVRAKVSFGEINGNQMTVWRASPNNGRAKFKVLATRFVPSGQTDSLTVVARPGDVLMVAFTGMKSDLEYSLTPL